jgi:hypothetical protein
VYCFQPNHGQDGSSPVTLSSTYRLIRVEHCSGTCELAESSKRAETQRREEHDKLGTLSVVGREALVLWLWSSHAQDWEKVVQDRFGTTHWEGTQGTRIAARYPERSWRLQVHRHGSCSDAAGSGLSPIAKTRSASSRASLSLSDIIRVGLGTPTHAPTWSLARLARFRHQGRCAARMFQVAALFGCGSSAPTATRFANQGQEPGKGADHAAEILVSAGSPTPASAPMD